MATVEAPNKAYNGPGPGGVVFVDGVGTTDDEAALNYYRGAGYAVDGEVDAPAVPGISAPDPRDVTGLVVGTTLRDAAVEPRAGDFLPPVNAGEANPHGAQVVAPEIHASGPAGIRPGVVFVEDAAVQERRESEFAEARLVDQVPAGEAVSTEVPDLDDRGELDLSDPGSASEGRVVDGRPARADSKANWVEYVVGQGAERDAAEAMTKDELRAYRG